jgi:2-polyprenyl-3-methyl-5-hydroxy-6-metoxy-1,4-benzoquinol methylase
MVIGELGRWNLWAAKRRSKGWFGSATWRAAKFRTAHELERLVRSAGLDVTGTRGAIFYPPYGSAAALLAPCDPWLGRRTTMGAAFLAIAAKKPDQRPERGCEDSMSNPSKRHWEQVYTTKAADAVSWFQQESILSLDMIAAAGVGPDAAIVDVGGGASLLVDRLLDRGFTKLTVLDVSEHALALAKARLGSRAASVAWVVEDVTSWEPPSAAFTLWHDRAVFHFLVDEADRHGYLRALDRGLTPGGFAIFATFALSGPERCSGLPIRRYSAATLQATLGAGYELVKTIPETHMTPSGNRQDFLWCLFRKGADGKHQ